MQSNLDFTDPDFVYFQFLLTKITITGVLVSHTLTWL